MNLADRKSPTLPQADPSWQLRILSVFAIGFVVLGHINFFAYGRIDTTLTEPFTFSGWFPYYSFHLPLFLFISGYYFHDIPEGNSFFPSLGKFILKKLRTLILPYYIFAGIFLLINTLIRSQGFTFGTIFSPEAWLVHPWTRPYVITFSTPAWYLPALFIAEIYFLLLRRLFRLFIRKSLVREIVLLFTVLLLGIAAVYYKETAAPSGTAVVYLRSVVMLFFMQVGALYRKHLEQHDTLPNVWYFLIVFAAQFLLILLSGNSPLSPGLYALLDFGKTGYTYFLGGLTGLMLWLRVSRLLASIPRRSRLILFIGENTKYIMAFHVFSWFLLNSLFSVLQTLNPGYPLLSDFSSGWYHSFLYYCCTGNPRMILLYLLAGMFLPLLPAKLVSVVKNKLSKTRT